MVSKHIQRYTLSSINAKLKSFIMCSYLFIYLLCGIYTEFKLINLKPIPDTLLEDFKHYERALIDALSGRSPYAVRVIGPAYLYPLPALFIVETFHLVKSFIIKSSLYFTINIFIVLLMIYKVAEYYGYNINKVWYWYVICFAFAPFLEILHIGQINIITLFGLFLLFLYDSRNVILSSLGLSLAIITKLSPVVFILYLFTLKRFKTIFFTILILLILIVISAIRYNLSFVLEYPDLLQWLTNQFIINTNSQSLVSKIVTNVRWSESIILDISPADLRGLTTQLLLFVKHEHKFLQTALTLYILFLISSSILITIRGNQSKEAVFIIICLGIMLLPNIVWYHHYIFFLLPVLVWMGWSRLNKWVTTWCLAGLLIIQLDRFHLTYGLLIHIFGHLSMLVLLFYQIKLYLNVFEIEA